MSGMFCLCSNGNSLQKKSDQRHGPLVQGRRASPLMNFIVLPSSSAHERSSDAFQLFSNTSNPPRAEFASRGSTGFFTGRFRQDTKWKRAAKSGDITFSLTVTGVKQVRNSRTSTLWPWPTARISSVFSNTRELSINIFGRGACLSLTRIFSGVDAARSSRRKFRRGFIKSGGRNRLRVRPIGQSALCSSSPDYAKERQRTSVDQFVGPRPWLGRLHGIATLLENPASRDLH